MGVQVAAVGGWYLRHDTLTADDVQKAIDNGRALRGFYQHGDETKREFGVNAEQIVTFTNLAEPC